MAGVTPRPRPLRLLGPAAGAVALALAVSGCAGFNPLSADRLFPASGQQAPRPYAEADVQLLRVEVAYGEQTRELYGDFVLRRLLSDEAKTLPAAARTVAREMVASMKAAYASDVARVDPARRQLTDWGQPVALPTDESAMNRGILAPKKFADLRKLPLRQAMETFAVLQQQRLLGRDAVAGDALIGTGLIWPKPAVNPQVRDRAEAIRSQSPEEMNRCGTWYRLLRSVPKANTTTGALTITTVTFSRTTPVPRGVTPAAWAPSRSR